MKFFLFLKNWQVFLLTFGLFLLGCFLSTLLDEVIFDHNPSLNGIDAMLLGILVSQTVCMVLANCWFYAIGTHLHKKYYYNSFVLVVSRIGIYATVILSTLAFTILPLMGIRDIALIFFTFLISWATLIYCSLFSGRLLKMAELKRDVSLSEFIKSSIGFLFYPIGVWWLQPRINKIFEKDLNEFDPKGPLDQNLNF
jgi:hypothetical protein